MTPTRGRMVLWVDQEIQLRLVIFVLIALALSCVVISTAVFFNVWSNVLEEVVKSGGQTDILYQSSFKRFVPLTAGLTILLTLLACLGMMVLSHKVAGPAYRIAKILKELQEGKDPAFQLRKGDSMGFLLEGLKNFADRQKEINSAALQVLERWRASEVKDLSLNISLKELENKLGRTGAAKGGDENEK